MRVTSQTFPTQLKETTNTLVNRENKISQQISTGMNIIDPSDDVAGFGTLSNYRTNELQTQQFTKNTNTATTVAQNSYQGMADLQTLMSRASELITSANGVSDASTYHIIGQEMGTIADQIASIANRQVDGVYLYGSTGNVAPLVANSSAPPSYVFNTSANYSSSVSSYEINANLNVNIGLTAGKSGTGSFNGFLYKSGQTTTDTYTLIASLATELKAATGTGDPFTAEGGYQSAMQQVNASVSLTSESVGIASAKLTQLSTNSTALSSQMTNLKKQASTLGDANTANLATDLTTVQTAYQAALQSGSKILNLSLLDYIN